MKLTINKNSNIEDVKKIFTACYPFLKIELYRNPADITEYKTIAITHPLVQPSTNNFQAEINIQEDKTVAELENDFLQLGLKAKIFRKSGNVWVGTSLTNNWTLQQQNTEAEELCRIYLDQQDKSI